MTQDEFCNSELGQRLRNLPAAKFSLFRDLGRALRRGYRTALRIVLVSRTEAVAVRIDQLMTVRRSGDWMAHLAGNPNVWEAGATEAEALGKLVISLRGRGAAQ